MRTNIEIDDELMREAQKATGQTSKKATVEQALRLVIKLSRQRRVGSPSADIRGAEGSPPAAKAGEYRDLVGSIFWIDFSEQEALTPRIAPLCVEHDIPLLHNDRDFGPMSRYLGLREFAPS